LEPAKKSGEAMGGKQSRLSAEDFSFLEEETGMARPVLEAWYANFLKDCPSGELSEAKFVQVYALLSKVFPGGQGRDRFTRNLFSTFDEDKSGTIDFREFMLALAVVSKRTPEDKLLRAFRLFDIDGDGWIDFSEMKRVVTSVYKMLGSEGCTQEKAKGLFLRMDGDQDGRVSALEFLEATRRDTQLANLLQATHVFLNSPAVHRRRT